MKRRGVAAVGCAIVLVAAAGCGSKNDASIARGELPKLVLQPADLPPVFDRFDEGRQLRHDVVPGPRADPGRFGRLEGWKARYRRAGSASTSGALVIESRADLYGADDGAERDLGAYRQEFEGLRTSGALATLPKPAIGEDAVAVELRQGDVVYFRIAWREHNATASVNVSGFANRTTVGDALAIARKQAARLHAAVRA